MDTISLPTDRPFTIAQALAWGHQRRAVSRLVERGALRRLFTGVYVDAALPLDQEVRVAAVGLVAAPDAVLCDRTAAWIWGVDIYSGGERQPTPPLELYHLRGHRRTERQGCDGGTRDLRPEDWVSIGGVHVTTPLRTAVDLACNLHARDALAAMDALAHGHGITRDQVTRLLPRYRRRRGVIQARRLARLFDPRTESHGESWTKEVLDACGFAQPEPQHWIRIGGVPTYRLDLAYPHAKIAIEYDGEEFHTSPQDRENDRVRRDWLRDHGWHVIVLTKESFTAAAIVTWTGELREELAHRTRSHKRF